PWPGTVDSPRGERALHRPDAQRAVTIVAAAHHHTVYGLPAGEPPGAGLARLSDEDVAAGGDCREPSIGRDGLGRGAIARSTVAQFTVSVGSPAVRDARAR